MSVPALITWSGLLPQLSADGPRVYARAAPRIDPRPLIPASLLAHPLRFALRRPMAGAGTTYPLRATTG